MGGYCIGPCVFLRTALSSMGTLERHPGRLRKIGEKEMEWKSSTARVELVGQRETQAKRLTASSQRSRLPCKLTQSS